MLILKMSFIYDSPPPSEFQLCIPSGGIAAAEDLICFWQGSDQHSWAFVIYQPSRSPSPSGKSIE